MLKSVWVNRQEFLLRSTDGSNWFARPADLLQYRRRRIRQRVELRERFIYAVDCGWNRKNKATFKHGGQNNKRVVTPAISLEEMDLDPRLSSR